MERRRPWRTAVWGASGTDGYTMLKIRERFSNPMLLLGVALVAIGLGACGGQSSSSSASSSTSASDNAVEQRIASADSAWNKASASWINAYKSGNRALFLRVQARYTQRMTQAVGRMQVAVSDIRSAPDRQLVRRVVDATAAETAAIVEIDKAVVNNDTLSEQLGLHHLTAAVRQKQSAGRAAP